MPSGPKMSCPKSPPSMGLKFFCSYVSVDLSYLLPAMSSTSFVESANSETPYLDLRTLSPEAWRCAKNFLCTRG